MDANGRKKARLLLAIWGPKYFDYLTEYALPSWLAPHNLPELARLVDLEIDILTRACDAAEFAVSPSFSKLTKICPVHFVPIDDLISRDMYTVTLSGAFGRGMIRHGEAMTDISFIFMNADFILSDGSLAHLGHLIARGETAIMAPSFRAVEEKIAPALSNLISTEDGTLRVTSRKMVGLALRTPHPTNIAKTMNQTGCVTHRPNQLYWRVNDDTFIGRYFLTFMLCIKPDRVVSHINSYCDYGFIQHFTSLSKLHTITDSDDLFMLELQSHDFERGLLDTGVNSASYIAQQTRNWATALHIENVKQQLLFHSGDLPDNIDTHLAISDAFIAEVLAYIPTPLDHNGHPHWTGGLINWRLRSQNQETPPEFNHPDNINGLTEPTSLSRKLVAALRHFNKRLNDALPDAPFWHFYWSTYRRFAQTLRAQSRRGEILFVHDNGFQPDGVIKLARNGALVQTRTEITGVSLNPAEKDLRFAALMVHPDRLNETGDLIEAVRARFPAIREIAVMSPLYLRAFPQTAVPASSILRDIDALLPQTASRTLITLAGQPLHILAHRLTLRLIDLSKDHPKRAAIVAALAAPFLVLLGIGGSALDALGPDHPKRAAYVTGVHILAQFGEKTGGNG